MTEYIIIYICFINILAVYLTVSDKIKAKHGWWRVPEKILFIVGFLGGAPFEYITMRLIRHKTKHKTFMIGLPCFMFLHILLIAGIIYLKTAQLI